MAVYAANCPEYLVGYFAAFKGGLVPFNVNYRYGSSELRYILDDGDAEIVLFQGQYTAVVDAVRQSLPKVQQWIVIPQPDFDLPDWATNYRQILCGQIQTASPKQQDLRTEDDALILYTGGSTGLPKGVVWRQEDLIARARFGANPALGLGPLESSCIAGARAKTLPFQPRLLIACPLMHGSGHITALVALSIATIVVLLPEGKFNAAELWSVADRERVDRITIVGQPFAGPMLDALQSQPGRWDLGNLKIIESSGAMWSIENKQGLLRELPHTVLVDSLSSSEGFGLGLSMTSQSATVETAHFSCGSDCAVFAENGIRVVPGSGQRGQVAVSGRLPVGYYKDEKRTAQTFRVLEGRRWSFPGDWAEVNSDGSLVLLGRGSGCVNSGGEKVFPQEVEEALKRHPAVWDAAVVGVPDDRMGENVVALVQLRDGISAGAEEIRMQVRSELASFKVPRDIVFTTIDRGPNGKIDYMAAKARALHHLQRRGK